MQPHRRLFLALWPDELLKARLEATSIDLTSTYNGRWIQPDNYHLTLQFLGNVPSAAFTQLERIAGGIRETGFEMKLSQLEHWRRPKVLALTAHDIPAPLARLHAQLHENLTDQGFQLEDRPFRPHVTVARDVTTYTGPARIPPIRWTAQDFVLAESTRDARGATTYVVLHRWALSLPN